MMVGSGQRVRPRADLEEARPELRGEAGAVLWSEQTDVVVQWDGKLKLYRVPTEMLEPIREVNP